MEQLFGFTRMKNNKRPIRAEIHPRSGHAVVNGYGHTVDARPFAVKFNGTRWKKLTRSLLVTTPAASHAIVAFSDGSELRFEI